MSKKRRNHSPPFKAKAPEAAREERTTAEITPKYDVHANQVPTKANGLQYCEFGAGGLLIPAGLCNRVGATHGVEELVFSRRAARMVRVN